VQIHVISSRHQSASWTTSIGQRAHRPLTSTLMYAALTMSTSPWCRQPNTPASSLRIPRPKTRIGNCLMRHTYISQCKFLMDGCQRCRRFHLTHVLCLLCLACNFYRAQMSEWTEQERKKTEEKIHSESDRDRQVRDESVPRMRSCSVAVSLITW